MAIYPISIIFRTICLFFLLILSILLNPQHAAAGQQLRTIIINNYHPYSFLNDKGQPDGFSVEIVRAVAKAMDLEIEIREDKWDLAMKELESGSIDLLPMMAFSPERDKKFDFSVPHTIAYDAIFFRKGTTGIRSLKDLSGKTVIVMNKDIAHSYLLSSGLSKTMNINLVDSLPEAFKQLAAGKCDAAIMPKLVGIVTAKKLNLSDIETSPQLIDVYTRHFSFAVKNGNQALLERLNQGLNIIKSSGQYDVIYKKWFGALEDPHLNLKTVMKFGSVAALVLFGFIVWNVMLNRQVRIKTNNLETEIMQRKASEERFRVLVDTIPDLIWLKDEDGVYLSCNAIFERFFGAKEADIVGKTDYDFVDKDLADFFREHDRKAMAAGKPSYNEEWIVFADDGHRALLYTTKTPMADNKGKLVGVLGIGHDITERRRTEEEKLALQQQFQQTHNLESLGVLAGSIAHNFNNILAVIIGHCGLLRLRPEKAADNIPEIEKAAERAAEICRQMLAYAGRTQIVQAQLNMTALVDEVVRMLKATIPQNAVIKHELSADALQIKGDPGQIRQIVTALILNSSEAIGEAQGEIQVLLAKVEIREGDSLKDHLGKIIPTGKYACLEVTDNGGGMDDEIRSKIFEPFYTTKFAGRGLGMSAVLGIITTHIGALQLQSQPGQGTTVKLYLPEYIGEPAGDVTA